MPKLILALHGVDLATALLSAAFRDRLAAVGATSLQVNVDDGPVAPALRFGSGEVAATTPSSTGGWPS